MLSGGEHAFWMYLPALYVWFFPLFIWELTGFRGAFLSKFTSTLFGLGLQKGIRGLQFPVKRPFNLKEGMRQNVFILTAEVSFLLILQMTWMYSEKSITLGEVLYIKFGPSLRGLYFHAWFDCILGRYVSCFKKLGWKCSYCHFCVYVSCLLLQASASSYRVQ